MTHETVSAIGKALAVFGVNDSGRPYRPHRIGSWRAADRHAGTAAARNRANTYLVRLPSYDPGARYFLLADIMRASSRGRPAGRQGCEGDVWMVRQRSGEAHPGSPASVPPAIQ